MTDPVGSKILAQMLQQFSQNSSLSSVNQTDPDFFLALMRYMPLRNLVIFSQGTFTEEMLENILEQLNNQN